MKELQDKAKALLESGAVQVVIGYGRGSGRDTRRPIFVRQADKAADLVFDAWCGQNLAVYLLKPEVKALGKAAIVASVPVLRSILVLAGESQVEDEAVVALTVTDDNHVVELATLKAIEDHVANVSPGLTAREKEAIAAMWAMPREQRWTVWQQHFANCVKCYACRASCPMCYCERCVVECNQPQWVAVPPHARGNLEWHIVRAMHLAGRCINCGNCASACPVGIPLTLLTWMLAQEVEEQFDLRAGASARKEYAMASFRPEDRESFIR